MVNRRRPASTAACAARASAEPTEERGPPYRSAGPVVGHSSTTESVGVPVPGTPACLSTCALASVTVITALTSADSLSRTGSQQMVLMVPGSGDATAGAGLAAQVGCRPIPVVADTTTPLSAPSTASRTSTAVSRPTPGPVRPISSAISVTCRSGSGRS